MLYSSVVEETGFNVRHGLRPAVDRFCERWNYSATSCFRITCNVEARRLILVLACMHGLPISRHNNPAIYCIDYSPHDSVVHAPPSVRFVRRELLEHSLLLHRS